MKLLIYSMFLPLLPLAILETDQSLLPGNETTIIRCHTAVDNTIVCDDVRYFDDGSLFIKVYGHNGPGTYWEQDCP